MSICKFKQNGNFTYIVYKMLFFPFSVSFSTKHIFEVKVTIYY